MDRGAWQAAVYRVTKSWAKLKRLSMHTKNIFTKSCFHRLPLWLNWSACNAGDLSWIPGLGRSPGEGKGYPLQYFGLENSMDYIVHGVTKSRTRLSNFYFHFLSNHFQFIFVYCVRKCSNFILLHVAVFVPTNTYGRDCLFSIVYSFLLCP